MSVAQLALLAEVPLEGGKLDWSPDGSLLAVGTRDSVVLLAPLEKVEATVLPVEDGWENPNPYFGAVAFSPDGTRVAGGFTVVVDIWDIATGDRVYEFLNISGEVTSVDFSPDGAWIGASGMGGGFVARSTGSAPIFWIDSEPERTTAVTFSLDSKTLAASGNGIDVWDPASGDLVREIPGVGFQLAFSPDGTMLADGVRVLDPASGDLISEVQPAEGTYPISLAFDPTGTILALGYDDGSVRLVEPTTGEVLHTLTAHDGTVLGLAFSPDERLLASTGSDQVLRLWGVPAGP